MNEESSENIVPFKPGDWVIDKNNPGQPGQYTGNFRRSGPHIMVELSYPAGGSITGCIHSVNTLCTSSSKSGISEGL